MLFTGATFRELTYLPRGTVTGDTMIFRSSRDTAHPADLGIWVIPSSARPLLHAATHFQRMRFDTNDHLFADAIGNGKLHLLARICGVAIPALHPWRDGWLRSTIELNLTRMFPDHSASAHST